MVGLWWFVKKIHKQLNLDDVEDGDLVKVDGDSEAEEKAYSVIAQWNWQLDNYYLK